MEDNDPVSELRLVIERLPAGFDALREEARAEGYLFVERLAADWEARRMRFDGDGEALLAAHVAGVLAGIGGLTIEPVLRGALRMRRFYVRPLFRSAGIGRKLATALLERARITGQSVTVNAAPASVSFWESLGFAPDMRDEHTHLYRGFCQWVAAPPEGGAAVPVLFGGGEGWGLRHGEHGGGFLATRVPSKKRNLVL